MTNLDRAITRRSDMIRAVLYCRVSTKEQTLNLSLSTQLEACREYCTREGFEVAAEFIEEGESAKTSDRPELQHLLAYCRQHRGQVQYLIVYNLSRFARERHDHVVLRVLLQRLGVTLRSVTEPIDDTSTGKLMEGVLSSFAQFDNDVRADRTKAGMEKALRSGRWPFQAPVGYLNARGSGSSSLTPDLERAPLIRQAFEEYAAGNATKEEIRRRVNSLGLRTRRGAPLSAQSFNAVLRNPIYAGRLEVPTWGCSHRGDFEPLVSEDIFRRVAGAAGGKGCGGDAAPEEPSRLPLAAVHRLLSLWDAADRQLVDRPEQSVRLLRLSCPWLSPGQSPQGAAGRRVRCVARAAAAERRLHAAVQRDRARRVEAA